MRPRDRIAQYLVTSVLVVAPFALGGAPRWSVCVTGALAATAAAAFLTSKREIASIPPLLAFLGLAALLTLLQVLPLPSGLVALLSPGKHQLVSDNARALGESGPSWIALSLDPAATRVELAKLCGYVAFAYASLRIAANDSRKQWMLSVVALLGCAMAVTTLLHLAFDAERVFGIYRPQQALRKPTLAPLLNHNHLSALMALSASIAVGLAIAAKARVRVAWIAVALACAAVGLLAESRGGAIALFVGVATVGTLAVLQRKGPGSTSQMTLPDKVAIGVATLSGLILLGVLTAGGVLRDLVSTRMGEMNDTTGRFAAWRSSSHLLQEFPWTGIGRGSFEMASTRVHDSHAVIYPHVENEYLQAVVDWGVLGAGALALVMVWFVITAVRNARSIAIEAGALGGCIALAVENFTDFSLWMPGVALPAIAAAATLAPAKLTVVTSTKARGRTIVFATALALIVLMVSIAATPLARSARSETRQIAAAQGKDSPFTEVARVKAVFERHPSDYASAGLLAQALFRARDRRAIAVVNRALDLHPTSGELYRLAGRMLLASQRREQASAAYASALRFSPSRETLDEILSAFPSDAEAVRALPMVPSMVREWTDQLRQQGRVRLALAYLQRYLSFYPDDAAMQLHAAAAALDANDVAMAIDRAGRAFDLDPSVAATSAFARALVRNGAPERALGILDARLARPHVHHGDRVDLALVRAEILGASGALDAARHTLHSVLNIAENQQLVQIHRRLAELEERLGNKHQAAWERERAAELDR